MIEKTETPLKPCPHCGGKAELERWTTFRVGETQYAVRCAVCGANGPIEIGREGEEAHAAALAAKGWNRRQGST